MFSSESLQSIPPVLIEISQFSAVTQMPKICQHLRKRRKLNWAIELYYQPQSHQHTMSWRIQISSMSIPPAAEFLRIPLSSEIRADIKRKTGPTSWILLISWLGTAGLRRPSSRVRDEMRNIHDGVAGPNAVPNVPPGDSSSLILSNKIRLKYAQTFPFLLSQEMPDAICLWECSDS